MLMKKDSSVKYYVHRRDGNEKRNFVLVNRDLAKHYPCDASDTIRMCNSLAEKGFNNVKLAKSIVVVSFAETATALGIIVSKKLKELNPKCDIFLITTTREKINFDTKMDIIEFQEKHSHATEQALYFGSEVRRKFSSCDKLVIIDDELSTGNTVLNLIDQMEEKQQLSESTSVETWSLLNGMNDSDKERFRLRGIELVYLEEVNKPEIEKFADTLSTDVREVKPSNSKLKIEIESIAISNRAVRYGAEIGAYTKEIESKVREVTLKLDCSRYCAVDVIGTEECMYPAIVAAEVLKSTSPSAAITCHSTTRSPIVANSCSLLSNRVSLTSLYSSARNVFLYNAIETDCDVLTVVITDAVCSNEEEKRFAASLGCCIKDVIFINLRQEAN